MKTIITVIGKDKPGIVATISACLFAHQVNILDVSQTIMNSMFTMIMVVELDGTFAFEDIKASLLAAGEKADVRVTVQREEIINAMHRV